MSDALRDILSVFGTAFGTALGVAFAGFVFIWRTRGEWERERHAFEQAIESAHTVEVAQMQSRIDALDAQVKRLFVADEEKSKTIDRLVRELHSVGINVTAQNASFRDAIGRDSS